MENYMSEKKVITGKVRFNYVNLIYPKKIGESRDEKERSGDFRIKRSGIGGVEGRI
jgi:hypothetical protein